MNCKLVVRAIVLAGLFASKVAAQVYVTPTVKPTPPGQLIVVNNGPGDQTQPHVDGDLVCYTEQISFAASTIHYFNLTTHADAMVPVANDGSSDFLCDLRGTTIVFTRQLASSPILAFDTAVGGQPVEIAPQPGSMRFGGQIGDQTIVWEDLAPSNAASSIVAHDRTTGATTVLSPSSPAFAQNPGISPDGSIVVWEACNTAYAAANGPCLIWRTVRSGAGAWTPQPLVSQVQGAQTHPDTDGAVIAYSANFANPSGIVADRIVWQPAGGGTEHVLNLPGSAINPTVSGGLIAFDYDATSSGSHQMAVYGTASNVLYNLTSDPPNKTLNDISVTPDGKVRVVWQVLEADWNVYAFTFNLLVNLVTPTVAPTPPGQLIVVNNSPASNSFDPHVSDDLVAYSNAAGPTLNNFFTIRYFNLATGVDAGVPNNGTFQDFLADVRGSVIVFTRVSNSGSSIFSFDTGNPSSPVEVNPVPGPARQAAQIGDLTIAWQNNSAGTSSSIVAYDRPTGTTTSLTNDSALNDAPGISPDGKVIVWKKCATLSSPCQTWKATLSNGTWTTQQVLSQLQPGTPQTTSVSLTDTDGAIVAYIGLNSQGTSQLAWQPVAGGTEQALNLQGGQASFPSVSGGPPNSLIAFSYLPSGATSHDLALYNPSTNVIYNITGDLAKAGLYPLLDNELNDISITADGKVRVVWQALQAFVNLSVYAYTFNLPVGDFNLGAIAPMTIRAGGSGSTNVAVNPVNGFSSAVSLSVTGQPAGVMASLSPNSVTPSGGSAATSVLSVSLPPFVVPSNFSLTITGASGSLSHSTTADVTVTSTAGSITNLIGDLLNAGCIDNAGIGNALTSKLSAAQSAASAGNIQTAINTLTALKNQINAQAGKHIATSCTIAGAAFNPVTVLLLDVQGLIDSLRVSMTPDPINGYVVDPSGSGLAGASVSILDGGGMTVATAVTDITGFYFFATTGVLASGSSYTVAVTGLPAGFVTIPPASPAFAWTGGGITIGTFVLN